MSIPSVDFENLRCALWRTSISSALIFKTAKRLASPDLLASWDGPTVRAAIVGSLTTDFIASAVACAIFREGAFPIVYNGLFGAYAQEILDSNSALHQFASDLVVMAPDWRDLVADLPLDSTQADVARAVTEKGEVFSQLWRVLNERGNAIFQNVLVSPTASYRGVGERSLPASTLSQTEMLTSELNARGESLVNWIDTDRLAGFVGRRQWSPDRLYHLGRLPFDMRFLPDYMRLFGGCWRAANGRSKKVLVVDLDNTLWGGVIGDDGLENIRLGPDTAEGEAFAFWGSYLKGLSRRGVTLAVSSKNDPDVARKAFAHPHLALSETDFAAFDCSWGDKAAGLRRISAELNVSLDSFVFADDNPAECDLIRRELPDVGVVELGDDPTAFVRLLEAEHWFDLPRYTREDFQRSDAYAGRRRALQARDGVTDMATYLSELEMFGEFREAGPNDIARIAQLEQKTNQFNVTTRRYDAARVSEFANSSDRTIAVFSLRDRYANHGLVSSLIAVREGHTLRIDSWLMSCRVFFRTAEQYILCRLVELARARGCNRIVGEYLPTEKNGVASSIYSKLGFTPLDDSGREWELDLRQATTPFVLECYVAEDPG